MADFALINNMRNYQSSADSVFFLKLVLYMLCGSIWLQVEAWGVALPLGLVLGVAFASHDHFQIDRKLEYVVLLFAAVISFTLPVGFVLAV